MVFREENLHQLLEDQGYFIVPLLTSHEIDHLMSVYLKAPKQNGAFTASAHLEETEIRKSISSQLKKVIEPKLSELVQGAALLGASLVVKSPGYSEILQPHQDWNIVDERYFRSYNIWIPLTDTTKENGAIMVMPGSHKWINTFRHSSIPCAFRKVHKELIEHMVTLDIPAGYALIYDHALIHASHANSSNESRVALAAGMKPQQAEMFFYWNQNGAIEVYDADENHFMEKNIFQRPTALMKREELEYDFPTVNFKMLCSFLGKEYKEESTMVLKPWFKVYTPLNVLREVVYRLSPNKK